MAVVPTDEWVVHCTLEALTKKNNMSPAAVVELSYAAFPLFFEMTNIRQSDYGSKERDASQCACRYR